MYSCLFLDFLPPLPVATVILAIYLRIRHPWTNYKVGRKPLYQKCSSSKTGESGGERCFTANTMMKGHVLCSLHVCIVFSIFPDLESYCFAFSIYFCLTSIINWIEKTKNSISDPSYWFFFLYFILWSSDIQTRNGRLLVQCCSETTIFVKSWTLKLKNVYSLK